MTGKYPHLGTAGAVLAEYEAAVSKSATPEAKLRAAFSAIASQQGSIARMDSSNVLPDGAPTNRLPSLETLRVRGNYKNSVENNPLSVIFNDGSGVSLSMPISSGNALNNFFQAGTFKL
jgi:hypothetical protein